MWRIFYFHANVKIEWNIDQRIIMSDFYFGIVWMIVGIFCIFVWRDNSHHSKWKILMSFLIFMFGLLETFPSLRAYIFSITVVAFLCFRGFLYAGGFLYSLENKCFSRIHFRAVWCGIFMSWYWKSVLIKLDKSAALHYSVEMRRNPAPLHY